MNQILSPHPMGCKCGGGGRAIAHTPTPHQQPSQDSAECGSLVLMRNYEPLSNPMGSRVQRFALQSVARTILPTSRTAKCLRLRTGRTDVQVWKSRNITRPAMAGCRPAAASGHVLCARPRSQSVAGLNCSRPWTFTGHRVALCPS